MVNVSKYNSPLGEMLIVVKDNKLVGLYFLNQKFYLSNIKESIKETNIDPCIIKVKVWLDKYFNKENPCIKDIDIEFIGSDFRKKVWSYLMNIPYGKTCTYKEIADSLGCHSCQAIGGAVAHNPISIIVPCHRVIGTNNKLVGYAGGLDKKLELLKIEGININTFK